ncbi:MAG: RNA methyltransferase substrate-binding domain-containing protein, partial [Crocinitomicaceae bacterium]
MGERDEKYSRDNYRDSDRGSRNYERRPKKVDESYIFGVRAVIEAIKAVREIIKILILKGLNKELFFLLFDALKGKIYQFLFV